MVHDQTGRMSDTTVQLMMSLSWLCAHRSHGTCLGREPTFDGARGWVGQELRNQLVDGQPLHRQTRQPVLVQAHQVGEELRGADLCVVAQAVWGWGCRGARVDKPERKPVTMVDGTTVRT